MKKTLLLTFLALLGMTQAVAQEYEYVPFVREGVKWVYFYDNLFGDDILQMPSGKQYYSFEMKGDVEINGTWYKPVVLSHYIDNETSVTEDFTPVYLREENKVVYAIQPDGIMYPKCPAGIRKYIAYPSEGLPLKTSDKEFVLYDFNDPIALYDSIFAGDNETLNELNIKYVDYLGTDYVSVGQQQSKRHRYKCIYHQGDSESDFIVEGVGCDGTLGMPLFYFEYRISGFTVDYHLSHVIEDGKIIYTGQFYDPGTMVGIDEVVADQRPRRVHDDNYYNLMGQPVGKTLPTTPGIYIHQGKKIVIR